MPPLQEAVMQFDPVTVMVDTAMRVFVGELFKAAVWIPILLGIAYLHARWSRPRV
jgi:hypothetical protein